VLADLRRDLALSTLPQHIGQQVRVQQLNRLTYLCRIMAVTGLNTLVFVTWTCWRANKPQFLLPTDAGLASLYVMLIASTSSWRSGTRSDRAAHSLLRTLTVLFLSLGTLWGLLLVGLIPESDGAQRSLLYGTAVGLISSAALSVPISATLAFGVPSTIGAFGALVAMREWASLPTAACLLGYVTLALAYAIHSNRTFIEKIGTEVRLQEQAEVIGLLLRDFIENSSDWLWQTDAQFRLTHVSDRMVEVAGSPADSLLGLSLPALIERMTEGSAGEYLAALMQQLSSCNSFRDLAVPVRVAGETRWWSLTGKPAFDRHRVFTGYQGIGSDITEARRSTERIAYLARHDSLTSLPNRVLFTDALNRACSAIETGEAGQAALLCLDLDGFKAVNDTLGHAVGDALLVAVADRLRRCVREGDVAARLGGDEFAVIMADAAHDDAARMAARIVESLGQPYNLDGQRVEIAASVGVVVAQPGQSEPTKLLQDADLALYRAKAEGRRTWRFFDAVMDVQVQDRQLLRAELQGALDRGEFRLEFQPVVGLSSRRVVAAEALLRWRHPTRGSVSPPEFVELAEETGLICLIGAWVLDQAIKEASTWPAPIIVAVNLSPVQFRDAGLVTTVTKALQAHAFPPTRLELEITESVLLQPTSQTLTVVRQLRELGIRIALDDFGTGYSSLSYLRRFPFDTLKVDRSFVSDLGRDKPALAIVKAIVDIACNVGMTVTAEGVETEQQAAILESCGCERAQGYLFGKPQSAAAVRLHIARDASRRAMQSPPLLASAAADGSKS
jgi:diguanylate cyclase (GGDEF)-like protein/PAS domain S-box-containing protein